MKSKDFLDESKPFDTVYGFGTCQFKYTQGDAFYNAQRVRVNPETGAPWAERDAEKAEDIAGLEEAAKADEALAGAAKAAKDGVVLPRAILAKSKGKAK